MRKWLLTGALMALAQISSPALAETTKTTANIQYCDTACLGSSSLRPFDSSLGQLNGIALQIDGYKLAQYFVSATTFPPDAKDLPLDYVFGTADVGFTGTFNVLVNGQAYSFGISAPVQHIEYTRAGTPSSIVLKATGSGSFDLDPSLFSTFIDTANTCLGFNAPAGICVGAAPGDGFVGLMGTSQNLSFSSNGIFGKEANLTLTYNYTPWSDLPEPSTWAMMLMGFVAVGVSLRARRSRGLSAREDQQYV